MSVIDDKRGTGSLVIAQGLASDLSSLRAKYRVTTAATLSIDELRAVEQGVGMRFEDDVLAVFAAQIPVLAIDHQMTLRKVLAHTSAFRQQGGLGDWIAVGKQQDAYWLIEMRARSGGSTVLHQTKANGVHDDLATAIKSSVAEFVRVHTKDCPKVGTLLEASVVRPPPESFQGRWVDHKVFGKGRILATVEGGRRMRIDFPGKGLKTLDSSYVTVLDSAGENKQ